MAKSRRPPGLEALGALRGKTRARRAADARPEASGGHGREDGTTDDRLDRPKPRGKTPTPDDIALFRESVGDVAPIRSGDRAELDVPKPPPVPRQRQPIPPDAPSSNEPARNPEHLGGAELFRAMMGDVTPLRDTGRTEPAAHHPALPHARAIAGDPLAKPSPETVTPLLPPDSDSLPPETLFRHMVRGTQPIDARNRVELQRPPPLPEPIQRSEDERAALRETMQAPMTLEDRLEMGEEAAFLRPGLPRRVLTDLRRGRWVLQGELDLHGLNREEAREALANFLATSLVKGRRCVRVIHGKGLGSPGRISILKQLSRGWLAQREEILAFCQAAPHDGGSGALMVLIRSGNPPRQQ